MTDRTSLQSLRLFLKEICADILRTQHFAEAGSGRPMQQIAREVKLPTRGSFADLCVVREGKAPLFVDVKYGVDEAELVSNITRKYSGDAAPELEKLIVVLRSADYAHWGRLCSTLRELIKPPTALEFWEERDILDLVKRFFAVDVDRLDGASHSELRRAIDSAKWNQAFGSSFAGHYLEETLLWHFSHWSLHTMHTALGLSPEKILQHGVYSPAAVVISDLCGFSGYVQDTKDAGTIRRILTSFYSASRHAIHDAGGMFYQFIGDAAIGVFGVPVPTERDAGAALRCARALRDIGESVSNRWQRQIDRVQPTVGVRVGIALGEVNLLPLRPFSQSHIGLIGDTINLAERMTGAADAGQIVVSNSFFNHLPSAEKKALRQLDPIEAKNVGRIQWWQADDGSES